MRFTIDGEVTVDVQLNNYRKAVGALRSGDLNALFEYVNVVDTNIDVRR